MSLPQFNNPDFSVGLTDITNFPGSLENDAIDNVDFWTSLFDLPSELIASAERFNQLRSRPPQAGDALEIQQLLDVLTPYLITPEMFNRLTASMTKIQYMWHTEIHDYIRRMQDQLKFFGNWNATTEYKLHNKVSRPHSSQVDPHAGEMFICINRNGSRNNPLPVAPSFENAHWRRISTTTQGAPGIAVNWVGDWTNVQGQSFEIGDSIRFQGVEYYCRIPTTDSPATNPEAWETFWPVIWMRGDEDSRPFNNSMRQNTILYRTHGRTTFVERFENNEWHSMELRTNIHSIEFESGVMLPDHLDFMRQETQKVQSNLDEQIANVRQTIGPLQNMNNVIPNARANSAGAIDWVAGRVNSAHELLERENDRLNILEGRDLASQFLSLNGSNQMSGHLNLANQSLVINSEGVARSAISAAGTNRNTIRVGNPDTAFLELSARTAVRVGNNNIIHAGNIASQTVASAGNVGGVVPGNIARTNQGNTFTGNNTINGVLTMGGATSQVRSNNGTLTLGSGNSNSLVLSGNNVTVAGQLTATNIEATGWLQGQNTYTNSIRNHAGGRTYMTTTNAEFANFPGSGGLAINGNRIYIQSAQPSNPPINSIWFW